ncbi:MAG TPA: SDR family oxidoreductase [Gaiellaceae bacterium]|nr:SDR family oxidoreductase [Gaiellaceae bacterium]
MTSRTRILLTGATGYVGGRLLTALLERGEDVRCLARRPAAVPPHPGLEVVAGDVLDEDAVRRALDGVGVAYYLVHAMGSADSFEQLDRRAATIFAAAARDAGVRQIVYLGGLGSGPELSPHLASRQEVGRLLASTGVETIEFRASIVIGSGSLSFELVRALSERLPVMITPRWVRTRAQPIAVEDVVAYLVAALDLDSRGSEVFEIGGADVATYGELMREYARLRGLRRLLVPVPVLTPRLSSLWLGLVTPVYARVGRKLVESLPHETVVRDPSALERFPVRPRGYREAIARALANEDHLTVETRWSDAFSAAGRSSWLAGPSMSGRLVDARDRDVPVPPARAFAPIRRIGGQAGWYYGDALWHLRGFLDLLVGGVGLRRGRRDPETPAVGSALDFWRVEAYEPDRLLRLRAEMRLPGRAWLQFEVDGDGRGSRIHQTAIFDPTGLAGLAYWYALLPIHAVVFRGMLAGIAREATRDAARSFAYRHASA